MLFLEENNCIWKAKNAFGKHIIVLDKRFIGFGKPDIDFGKHLISFGKPEIVLESQK